MPFKSEAQRRYLWANEPEIARDWADTYGSRIQAANGGIMDVAIQGGVDNYLGKQPQVQAPRKWQSGPDKPPTELAYITEAEKDLILKTNMHGGLEGGPNIGPSGIISLDSFGDIGGAGASGGDTSAGGGANQGAGFSGQGPGQSDRDFDRQKLNQRAALQIAERQQAQNLGYNERENIADATYGPLQKHTGERGFLGNLFRGANKYGYTDTYTSGPQQGQVKPGWGGRILGGLAGLATGVPFVGGAIGNAIDKGKGIFGRKPRDMSQYSNLGLYDDRMKQKSFYDDALLSDNYSDMKLPGFTNVEEEFDLGELIKKVDDTTTTYLDERDLPSSHPDYWKKQDMDYGIKTLPYEDTLRYGEEYKSHPTHWKKDDMSFGVMRGYNDDNLIGRGEMEQYYPLKGNEEIIDEKIIDDVPSDTDLFNKRFVSNDDYFKKGLNNEYKQAKVTKQDLAKYLPINQKALIDMTNYEDALAYGLINPDMSKFEYEKMREGKITKPGTYTKKDFMVT